MLMHKTVTARRDSPIHIRMTIELFLDRNRSTTRFHFFLVQWRTNRYNFTIRGFVGRSNTGNILLD